MGERQCPRSQRLEGEVWVRGQRPRWQRLEVVVRVRGMGE